MGEVNLSQTSHLLLEDMDRAQVSLCHKPGTPGAIQTRPPRSELNGEHGCLTLDSIQPSTSLRQLKRKQTQTLFTVSNT